MVCHYGTGEGFTNINSGLMSVVEVLFNRVCLLFALCRKQEMHAVYDSFESNAISKYSASLEPSHVFIKTYKHV